MIMSEDRLSHITHLIIDGIWKDDLVDFEDDGQAIRIAKVGSNKFSKEYDEVDRKARATVTSLKRNVPEGSPEWDILYRKYFEQELSSRGK